MFNFHFVDKEVGLKRKVVKALLHEQLMCFLKRSYRENILSTSKVPTNEEIDLKLLCLLPF